MLTCCSCLPAEGLYKEYVDDPGMCPDPKSGQCVTKVVRPKRCASGRHHLHSPCVLAYSPMDSLHVAAGFPASLDSYLCVLLPAGRSLLSRISASLVSVPRSQLWARHARLREQHPCPVEVASQPGRRCGDQGRGLHCSRRGAVQQQEARDRAERGCRVATHLPFE